MNVTEADWDFLPEILSRWLVRREFSVPADLDGIRRNHLEAFAYYFAKDALTTEVQREFGAVYQAQSIRSLRMEHAVHQLETLFQTHNVRFVWIKGADLGLRLYPSATLRLLGDLDVWIHPDDCGRIRRILDDAGWHTLYEYPNMHHFAMRHKSGIGLEPHFSLPGFDHCSARKIWDSGINLRNSGQGVLTPELNLLMLIQHASCRQWRYCQLAKLLSDMRLICSRETVDFAKLRRLAVKFDCYSPDLIFASFRRLFHDIPVAKEYASEILLDFTCLLTTAWNGDEHEMCLNAPAHFSRIWWRHRLPGLHPDAIRLKYHLPPGNLTGLPAGYWRDITRKTSAFFRYLLRGKNRELEQRLQRLERIQKTFRSR